MNEKKSVSVRDLAVGVVVLHYGRVVTVTAIEQGPRFDGRWIYLNGYKTHRWLRESFTLA